VPFKKKIKAIIESKEINKSGRKGPDIKKNGNKKKRTLIIINRFLFKIIILIHYISFKLNKT
jgi:hypothetical protein